MAHTVRDAVAFHDFKPEELPAAIEYIDSETGLPLRLDWIDGPCAYEVPAFKPRKVTVRITLATGVVIE